MDNLKGRRDFLKAAAAAPVAFTILRPELVRGTAANSAVRVGLLGCGRRGSIDATNVAMNTDARITALGDLFQDQLDKAKAKFDKLAESKGYAGIEKTFVGPKSSQQIVESKDIDAVIIATPAYFHTEHLAMAVAAGKHIYCEKPVAIDVANAKHVMELAKKVEGKMSVDVGFQIRSAPPFIELVKRIHEGALGDIRTGVAYYYCPQPAFPVDPNAPLGERRIRAWLLDRRLSGDIIVEQNIHVIDVCNWVLQGHPVKAIARSGRQGRVLPTDDMSSHFDVVFEYPNDVHVSFASTQFGRGPFEACERFFGTKAAAVAPYSGKLGIEGDQPWTWAGSEAGTRKTFSADGSFEDNLAQADSEKQKGFIGAITSGQFHNQLAQGAESALAAMLGRKAGYAGHEVTWDEMLKSNEKWNAEIDVERL